ncbi:MAG: hypothetical protein ACREH8_19615 [Opitutaceae bacterium]
MDNNKAKLRLGVYRRTGEDARDPFFAGALQQAEKDPALRGWLAEQQAFDTQFAAALGEIRGPKEGRALIEATMMQRPFRLARWWPVAMAASIAMMLALYVSFGGKRGVSLPQTASVAEMAHHLTEHHASIGLMSRDYTKLRAWIAEKGGPLPDRLPPGLAQLGVLGCQTWETNRGKVSLVCFVRGNKEMIHLYVFENPRDGASLPDITMPRIERAGEWSFALWREGGSACALGAMGPDAQAAESLRALFRA